VQIVGVWLRLDLRRRWRSLAVLALLVAVASGTVLTALAGARRGATAVDRLKDRTLPATAAILANTPNFDWSKARTLPEVEAFGYFGPTFPIEGLPPEIQAEPMIGDAVMDTLERPVVLAGRMFDRGRVDEAVTGPGFLEQQHKRLGETVQVVLPTPAELRTMTGSGPGDAFTGPRLAVRIVGVVSSPWWGDPSVVNLSPAVAARYPDSLVRAPGTPSGSPFYANALVRLHGGTAAIPRLRTDFARVTGRSDIEVIDLSDWVDRPALQQTSFEARCLLAFGAAAFLAALFLVGQAVARSSAAATAELQPLRAVGMNPAQSVATAAATPAVAGVLGGALGVAAAVVASRWFPIGLAKRAEPSPGTSADWLVLGPGLAAAALLVAAGAAVAAWLALGASRRAPSGRRSAVAAAVTRAGLPVPVVVGTRFALEPGRGRTAVPVRPALVGAVVGVLGLLAALTFARGVADVAGHPEKFGQTYQLNAFVGDRGQDAGPTDRLLAALRRNVDVQGVEDARTAVATGSDGDSSVSLYSYSAGPKPIDTVVTSGRMPRSADEVLLAPRTMETLRARVGEPVALTGSKGTVTLTVTGTGLVPAGAHNTYADGGWITEAGYDALFTSWKFRTVYVALRPSARTPDAGERLTAALTRADPALAPFVLEPSEPLREVTALEQVRMLPILLGIFLGLLAVGAVGHALVTAVRRRQHDIAVLRAVGMTRRQCRWIAVTQAMVLALVGLMFGVPLGVAVGRLVWRAVASSTPFQYDPPVALVALVLVGPAALLIVNVLAAWPGHRAARLRIAQVLRTE
jgi:cell division protein FtsX